MKPGIPPAQYMGKRKEPFTITPGLLNPTPKPDFPIYLNHQKYSMILFPSDL